MTGCQGKKNFTKCSLTYNVIDKKTIIPNLNHMNLKSSALFIFLTYFITGVVYIPLALANHGFIKFELPKWMQISATLIPGVAAII